MAQLSQTILITGGTSGLGRCAALKFLQQGHTVVITGRNEYKLQHATEWFRQHLPSEQPAIKLHTIVMDQSNLDSVRQAVETLQAMRLDKLDVVIHNAGGLQAERTCISGAGTTTAVEQTIFVNAVAPWFLTLLLLKSTEQGIPRILFVTSMLHDPDVRRQRNNDAADAMLRDPDFDNFDGHVWWDSMAFYRVSKLAQLWLMYLLAEQYPGTHIHAICPGFVPTTMLNRHANWYLRLMMRHILSYMSFATSEDAAADSYVYYATDPHLGTISGQYLKQKKVAQSSEASRDTHKARQFWNMACDICQLPDKRFV